MNKDNANFLATRVHFAIVIHASLEDIERLKNFLNGLPDIRVVYQRADVQKLWIMAENEGGRRGP